MNRMIQIAYGTNYVEEILKLILGDEPDVTPKYQRHVYTQFVTSPKSGILERVIGKNRAYQVLDVKEVFINRRRGQRIHRPESMGHRYAYVIAANDDSLDAAKDAAVRAAQEIQFVLKGK